MWHLPRSKASGCFSPMTARGIRRCLRPRLLCDSHDWNWQIPHFVANHRVIAPDLRGHGRSGVPEKDFEPRTFAADIAGLIDQLGCGPVVAVGHSLGGVIVSALAVEYPDKVRAVVSVDPGYLVPDESRPVLDGLIGALRSGDPVATAQGFLAATYTPASPAHLRTWHLRRIAGVPNHVLQDTLAGLFSGPDALGFRGSAESYLRRRECPVLAFYTDPSRAAVETCSSPTHVEGGRMGRVGSLAAPGATRRVQPPGRLLAGGPLSPASLEDLGHGSPRKNARMSPAKRSGASMAAKCPPRSKSDHCTMLLPVSL